MSFQKLSVNVFSQLLCNAGPMRENSEAVAACPNVLGNTIQNIPKLSRTVLILYCEYISLYCAFDHFAFCSRIAPE